MEIYALYSFLVYPALGTEGFRERRHEDEEDDDGCFHTVVTYWTIRIQQFFVLLASEQTLIT